MPKLPLPPTAEPPKTLWEKTLNYSPVVMTVIATLLAGMSNSELSAAQYERASGAQFQSKAADQWSFFQVKKIRGSSMDNTLDLIQSMGTVRDLDIPALTQASYGWAARLGKIATDTAAGLPADDPRADSLKSAADEATKACAAMGGVLGGGQRQALIAAGSPQGVTFVGQPYKDETVRAAIDAIEKARPDDEVAAVVRRVSPTQWQDAFSVSQANSAALDAAIAQANKGFDSLRALMSNVLSQCRTVAAAARVNGSAEAAVVLQREVEAFATDLAAARLRFGVRRYELEAPINKDLALLTEVKVRQCNLEAERHRERSRLFFYGVLVAQAAVIGATLALAMRQKSLLWGLAAVAGLGALSFAAYVRIYI